MVLELLHKPKMADLTSLGVGGTARALAKVHDEDGLNELSLLHEKEQSALFPLGRGSNLLADDVNLNQILVQVDRTDKIDAEISGLTVRVPASMNLPKLMALLIRNGFSGMEGLAGIPGSVGGGIAMNAGSYGTDMAASVKRVRLWTPQKGLLWKEPSEVDWGYRHFSPRTDEFTLIWEVEFSLNKSTKNEVKNRVKKILSKKKATQPVLE